MIDHDYRTRTRDGVQSGELIGRYHGRSVTADVGVRLILSADRFGRGVNERRNMKDIAYYTGRLHTSLEMAAASPDMSARKVHQGLARLYRARLASLHDVDLKNIPLLSIGEPKRRSFPGSPQAGAI